MHSEYNVDLLLLSCPSKVMDYPCLSLPALTGFLKQNNMNVLQWDLNIEIKDRIFSTSNLEKLYKNILPFLLRMNINNREHYSKLKQFYSLLKKASNTYGFEMLEGIKEKCQKREYEILQDSFNYECFDMIFNISKACDFLFAFIYMYFPLFQKDNIPFFLTEYMELVCGEIIKINPRMIGLTMITTQNNFSLWFAHHLKNTVGFKGYILIGGPQPTKFEEQYLNDFSAIDFAIAGEGEYPLLQLTEEIKKEEPKFDQISRLIYRVDGKVKKNRNVKFLKECYQAAYPDYEGFPLDKYLAPVFPILASSNCPWKKCKFCAHRTSFREDYNERSPENVVDEMEYMYKKYGISLFHFADEAISSEHGARIGGLIQKRGLPFYWMSFGRLDEEFNERNLEQWYKGGGESCRMGPGNCFGQNFNKNE
ncbi:MAG: hypothetical protein BWY74_03041 [Firmicutes bacterium ADurb.Bin419]|nr:MAG: hypothetical protein BWY74_03041 [Firmicutes bacterium ADurb.Bin419]